MLNRVKIVEMMIFRDIQPLSVVFGGFSGSRLVYSNLEPLVMAILRHLRGAVQDGSRFKMIFIYIILHILTIENKILLVSIYYIKNI